MLRGSSQPSPNAPAGRRQPLAAVSILAMLALLVCVQAVSGSPRSEASQFIDLLPTEASTRSPSTPRPPLAATKSAAVPWWSGEAAGASNEPWQVWGSSRRATAAPSPTPTLPPLGPDDLNVLLLGCDEDNPSWRTDVIVVVAIRPRAGFVGLFSIPRDLWVNIPGYGEERINVADYRGEADRGPGGGPTLVAETLQQSLGIPIHAYARVHFDGLVRIVDALGGVTIDVDRDYPQIGIQAGQQHLDGRTALQYARDRSTTNDLDRTRRQQQILLAMRQAALRPAVLLKLPGLLEALPGVVETDLSMGQISSLAALALRLRPESIHTRVFDTTMAWEWVTPGRAMVLVPYWPQIRRAWVDLTTP